MIDRVINDSTNRITQGYQKGVHNGVDLGWRTDESQNIVYSNSYGEVFETLDGIPDGSEEGGGWGNYVLVRHPNGIFSRYAHLRSGLKVKKGDKVDENTPLGIIGESGRAYGRHLHFEVSYSSSAYDRFDPTPYLVEPIYETKKEIEYIGHVEGYGWQNWKHDGEPAGTTGSAKRLEAIQRKYNSDVYAKAHIEGIGWKDYGKITSDTIIGTIGESRRLEALQLKGDFEYRVQIEESGWSTWTRADGIITLGSVGESLRIEAIEIRKGH